jgi:hypothetical protein
VRVVLPWSYSSGFDGIELWFGKEEMLGLKAAFQDYRPLCEIEGFPGSRRFGDSLIEKIILRMKLWIDGDLSL